MTNLRLPIQPNSGSGSVPTNFRSGNKCERLEPLPAGLVPPVPTVPTVFRITETHCGDRAENPRFQSLVFNMLHRAIGKSGGNSGNGGNSQIGRGLRAFPLIQRGVNRWEHKPVLENQP
jgi:hypothetical protein